MVKKNLWSGMLVMVIVFMISVSGCVSSYHIQTFSDEVHTLPSITTTVINSDGSSSQKEIIQGTFEANDYESAMRMAEAAGYTEILSVESGAYQIFFFFGIKWVRIRCAGVVEAEEAAEEEGEQTNNRTVRQASETPAARQPNNRTGRQTSGTSAVPQLGEPTVLQQGLNLLPAVPITGKNLKFEFGGDAWIARVNGENFLSGNCMFEKNGNGYTVTLQATNIWTGAVEEVIDLLQKTGVPLGPAAGPLRTAARLAARVARWIPLTGSAIILEYNEGPPANVSFVKMEK